MNQLDLAPSISTNIAELPKDEIMVVRLFSCQHHRTIEIQDTLRAVQQIPIFHKLLKLPSPRPGSITIFLIILKFG
jgi:hypothetical protein